MGQRHRLYRSEDDGLVVTYRQLVFLFAQRRRIEVAEQTAADLAYTEAIWDKQRRSKGGLTR